MPLFIGDQAVPSKRRMVPLSPTDQIADAVLPQTLVRVLVVPLAAAAQVVPSKWVILAGNALSAPGNDLIHAACGCCWTPSSV
jgi:hypothetical protein